VFYLSARHATSSKWMPTILRQECQQSNVTYQPDVSRRCRTIPMSTTAVCADGPGRAEGEGGLLYVQQTARNWPSILDVTGAPAERCCAEADRTLFPVAAGDCGRHHALTNRLLIDGAPRHVRARDSRSVRNVNPSMINVLGSQPGGSTGPSSSSPYSVSTIGRLSYITGASFSSAWATSPAAPSSAME